MATKREPAPDFELENVGAWGPTPFRLTEMASREEVDALVLLLQRDHHCPKCRAQVREMADANTRFVELGAHVVAVLPESIERARTWQERYNLPFALLADPDKTVGAAYDQPTRFGLLGKAHDMIGRMPEAVVLDTRDGQPMPVFVHKGEHPADRPSVDELLAQVDRAVAAPEV